VQRKEPVAARGRAHGEREQAVVRFGHRHRRERPLYEVQLASDCDGGVSRSDDCFPVERTAVLNHCCRWPRATRTPCILPLV